MTEIYDVIRDAQSGAALDNLARTVGAPPEQVALAAQAILPEFAQSIERNTLSRDGLADLIEAVGQGQHVSVLENAQTFADAGVRADGDAILGHLFGSSRQSEQVVQRAAQASGLGEGVIKMLLPILAQMLMGAIGKYLNGNLGDILKRLPGSDAGDGANSPGSDTDRRSRRAQHDDPNTDPRYGSGNREPTEDRSPMGRGFELPRNEVPTGGYPLPPISDRAPGSEKPSTESNPWPGGASQPAPRGSTRNGGALPRQSPLPLPGAGNPSDNPLGDLPDILRRGGKTADGTSLGNIIRNMLGSLLGYQSRGVMGWLVRLIVMRMGWGILQRILKGLLGRK